MPRLRSIFLNRDANIRAGWRILMYAALTAGCAPAALAGYYALGGLVPAGTIQQEAELEAMILINVLLCAAGLLPALIMLRFVDRRPFGSLGYGAHGRVAVELGQGALLGCLMVTVIFVIEAAAAWIRPEPSGIGLNQAARLGLLYGATFVTAAALEELLARGYILQGLVQGLGRIPAVLITSFLFGLGHAVNPHAGAFSVLNTTVAGIWLCAAYLKCRSLWLPTSLHVSWNFVLAFVYGFPVSGLDVSLPLIRQEERGPDWVTGGDYGPEAGILGTVVFLAGTVLILRLKSIQPSPRASALWIPPAAPQESPATDSADSTLQ
jgi:membrane protease YdiL (CAAX protease family)